MRLSILDLIPVRSDQTTGDALAVSLALAQVADRLGFTRYWVAEHHNVAAIASTSPPVVIAHLAARTSRIRLGSGGVMLPNHAPLAVAEQFALLEALTPGRIDLGIGRAPGTDSATTVALRGARDGPGDIENFPRYVDEVAALMRPEGATIAQSPRPHHMKATPVAVGVPPIWLLGSSVYSARLAAVKGLPYVFAHHFARQGADRALDIYRTTFVPSEFASAPTTFMTATAVVAADREQAEALMLPHLHMMARLAAAQEPGPIGLADEPQAKAIHSHVKAVVEGGMARAIVGTPAEAADAVRVLAHRFDVDEVMVNPVASAFSGADPATAPAREATLQYLAEELL